MIIKLIPIRSDEALTVTKLGDVLTINGQQFDFSPLLDGAILPAEAIDCPLIFRPVERIGGDLVITLLMAYREDASAAALFPADIINPPDGAVRFPE